MVWRKVGKRERFRKLWKEIALGLGPSDESEKHNKKTRFNARRYERENDTVNWSGVPKWKQREREERREDT